MQIAIVSVIKWIDEFEPISHFNHMLYMELEYYMELE